MRVQNVEQFATVNSIPAAVTCRTVCRGPFPNTAKLVASDNWHSNAMNRFGFETRFHCGVTSAVVKKRRAQVARNEEVMPVRRRPGAHHLVWLHTVLLSQLGVGSGLPQTITVLQSSA